MFDFYHLWGGGVSPCMLTPKRSSQFSLQKKKRFCPSGFSAVFINVSPRLSSAAVLFSLCRMEKNAAANQSSWCQSAGCRSIAPFWPQSCSAGIISDPSRHPASGLCAASRQADVIILLNAPELTLQESFFLNVILRFIPAGAVFFVHVCTNT